MHPQTQAVIMAALTAGLITVIGWYVTYFLSKRKEEDARRQEATIRHLQKQIEDMYGPLLGLIQQRSIVYEIAARRLPSGQDGIIDRSRFCPEDAEIYRYIVETYFLPIDSRIATLLQTKIYLLESSATPESFKQFLKYHIYLKCLYGLWKDKGYDSTSVRGPGWPKDFEQDVEESLKRLRESYREYLKRLRLQG